MGQTKDPLYHRRSIRLPGYDYSGAGEYFVTIVSHHREPLFGNVINGEMRLSPEGIIVADIWNSLQNRYPQIELDCCVVMPNHFHAVLTIKEVNKEDAEMHVRAIHELPLRQEAEMFLDQDHSRSSRRRMLLPKVIGYFKMNTAKQINTLRGTQGEPVWLRNYYEHIISTDKEYENIVNYIQENPMNWGSGDEYYQ